MAQKAATVELTTEELVNGVLRSIEREREREIIARRFGLFDRKETLEQIGEMLGITRERVRQLEKSVIQNLKASVEKGTIPNISEFETKVLSILTEDGQIARVSSLTNKLTDGTNREEQARVAFLSQLCTEPVSYTHLDVYKRQV